MPEDATAPPGRGCAPMCGRRAMPGGRVSRPRRRSPGTSCVRRIRGNADRLASAPDFSLMLSSGGGSVVLTWVRDGASKRFAVPGD